MNYVVASLAVMGIVQGFLIWRLLRSLRRIDSLEGRVTRCGHGLALLVETTEAGFTMVGGELARIGTPKPRRQSAAATNRRVARATDSGRSIVQVAASEAMSEGEVRLRLFMNAAADSPSDAEEHRRGSVCA